MRVAKRKRYESSFKAKVALEALKERKTASELGGQFGVHPNQVTEWRKQLVSEASSLFERGSSKAVLEAGPPSSELSEQICRLKVEVEYLKKKQQCSVSERREWIARTHESLSVRQQCELLGLSRSTLYDEPVPDSDLTLRRMRLIDEQYLIRPYFGQRRMTVWLHEQGHPVNVKRVRRLMQIMGLEAIHPGPRLSLASPEHRVFPYLLRGMTIDRPDQVWSTDITYVPLARGFLYLVAVIDWFSRKVLSWELSNSLEVGFCVSALESALSVSQPEIFNTDQGSQFTSPQFTSMLSSRGIAISMDGRGRALDNMFIERFWRTLKYEDIDLKAYAAGDDLFAGLTEYIAFANDERPHMSLSYRTPSEVYLAT